MAPTANTNRLAPIFTGILPCRSECVPDRVHRHTVPPCAGPKLGRVTVDPTADLVLVVDYGAQYAQLIARRVREAKVYSEIVPHDTPVAEILAREPKAVILSGGPASVYAPGAPQAPTELVNAGVPTLGICYGFQAMAQALGGTVARTGRSEFGRTPLSVVGVRRGARVRARGRCGCRTGTRWRRRRPGSRSRRPHRTVRWRRSRTPRAACSGCSSIPRCCTPRAGRRSSSGSCTRAPAAVHCGPRRTSSRSRWRRSGPRSAASG